jgi:hypothetical protein
MMILSRTGFRGAVEVEPGNIYWQWLVEEAVRLDVESVCASLPVHRAVRLAISEKFEPRRPTCFAGLDAWAVFDRQNE